MEQYIPKSALVAEMEKLKEENKLNSKSISEYIKGGVYGFDLAIEKTLSILNTLEVKELAAEQEGICNGIFNRIVGNNCNLLIPLDKVGLKHGDKVKIFITKKIN